MGNHVSLLSGTRIGNGCKIFHGAVIGEIPQDLKFKGEDSTVEIGDGVTIRECVTVNRGTKALGTTKIGKDSLLMAYVHLPHDCQIGENVIIANGVQMAGHVVIDDWANISGLVPIHQSAESANTLLSREVIVLFKTSRRTFLLPVSRLNSPALIQLA